MYTQYVSLSGPGTVTLSETERIIKTWLEQYFSFNENRVPKKQMFTYFQQDTGSKLSYDKYMASFWNLVRKYPQKFKLKAAGNRRTMVAGLSRKLTPVTDEKSAETARDSEEDPTNQIPVVDLEKECGWQIGIDMCGSKDDDSDSSSSLSSSVDDGGRLSFSGNELDDKSPDLSDVGIPDSPMSATETDDGINDADAVPSAAGAAPGADADADAGASAAAAGTAPGASTGATHGADAHGVDVGADAGAAAAPSAGASAGAFTGAAAGASASAAGAGADAGSGSGAAAGAAASAVAAPGADTSAVAAPGAGASIGVAARADAAPGAGASAVTAPGADAAAYNDDLDRDHDNDDFGSGADDDDDYDDDFEDDDDDDDCVDDDDDDDDDSLVSDRSGSNAKSEDHDPCKKYAKKLSAFNMKNCNEYLEKMLPKSNKFTDSRLKLWEKTGAVEGYLISKRRAFLAYHFPPIKVKTTHFKESFRGDRFPQFSPVPKQHSVLRVRCEICIPLQHWISLNPGTDTYPRMKSTKHASRLEMESGKGYIEFEGMSQITTHHQSRYHQAAVRWLEEDSTEIRNVKPAPISKKNIPKTGSIKDYFPTSASHLN